MAFDFNSKHPHDPKKEFGTSASGESEEGMTKPTDNNQDKQEFDANAKSEEELFDTVYVAGGGLEDDEDTFEERTQKAAAQSLAEDERLEDEKHAKHKKNASVSEGGEGTAKIAQDNGLYDETLWGRYQSRRLGIQDCGDYFRINGKGQKNPRTGKREMTDKQIERMLVKAVHQKGWNKDLCFISNGKIDHALTSRAKVIFSKMAGPGGVCEGIQVDFRDSLPERAAHCNNPLARGAHYLQRKADDRDARRDAKKTRKSHEKCAKSFKRACYDEDGRTKEEKLTEKIRKPEDVMREREAAQREAMKSGGTENPSTGVGDGHNDEAYAASPETEDVADTSVTPEDQPKTSGPSVGGAAPV